MPHQSDLRFSFAVNGLDFEVVEFDLDEELCASYTLDVALASADAAIDFGRVLDQPAVLTIWQGGVAVRHVHGLVSDFGQGDTGFRRTRYRVVVEPTPARLALGSDWRIFQQQSVPEILADVLDEQRVTHVDMVTTDTHAAREYCVQAGDTHAYFVERFAREEGFV